ncbi:MAG: hypothetical protein ACREPM_20730, partial [Gemmatimonadaceae bacterium]
MKRTHRVPLVVLAAIGASACTSSGASTNTSSSPATAAAGGAIAPALDAITQADIRRDIFALGGDAMRGREAGTLDEMRATGWVAEHARDAGLQPAGDDGTFFQWWPMRRTRLSENSQLSIGGQPLRLWKDVVLLGNQQANVDLPIVFVADSAALATTDVRGKAVAMELPAIATQAPEQFTIRGNFQATISQRSRAIAGQLGRAGAAAVILVSNGAANEEAAFDATAAVSSRGTYGIDSAGAQAGTFARPATQAGQAAAGSAAANAGRAGRGGNGGA